jgi:hypothetical protein
LNIGLLLYMANLNFKKDLVLGNDGEDVVNAFLQINGAKYLNSNNDNKYDLKMLVKNKTKTYEIKTDVVCSPQKDTGNLFVEFQCRNKPSGIKVTEADWFVTYFKYLNEIWFIKTKDLKNLINEKDFHVIKNAGDVGSKTHGYLINRKKFKDKFHVYQI